ncbi:MAG: molybdate ABC transporter substrate-binding protein [Methylococcales bacterium]|nr:molybdate ABC transporter substrate-binding protein [Methylococcales bacterium]MDP3838591.1 molybdate ABC transporter substrate-binding protein [Methylococcales bacterium]
MFNKIIRLLTVTALLTISIISKAETTIVAVAANFTKPMTDVAELFEKSTGHSAKLSFGSSGKFVAQIENGAPFEVFLSADDKAPAKLEHSGFAVADSHFTYAIGKLVLWSATANLVDDQGEILSKGGFKHIALADPKLAPYGTAAMEVLKSKNLLTKLTPLFVQGENIAQTYQFVSTGNAELGFVALSQVIDNGKITSGSAWQIPENLYTPLRQEAVLLKIGEVNPAAIALMQFLKSPEAKAIISKYGYGLPN